LSLTHDSTFQPAIGLNSAHAQTVFAALRSLNGPSLRRERWDTPDGDFVDLDVLDADPSAPHVLLLHGLEGSSRSGYVPGLFRHVASAGWGGMVLNFRSCSGVPNRLARSYHAGDTADARWALERLRERTRGPLFAAGFSLGANVLALLLAELGESSPLAAAALISAPFDLAACAARLDGPGFWPRLYRRWYLRTLLAKARAKAALFPAQIDLRHLSGIRGIRDFDERVTAPVHGFAGAEDYYARASCGAVLARVRTPALVLSAEDDPIAPPQAPQAALDNACLELVLTARGGHVGFVTGSVVNPGYWAEERVLRYFRGHVDAVARGSMRTARARADLFTPNEVEALGTARVDG
jgi:predicted alpha/beta-fold hydrolase